MLHIISHAYSHRAWNQFKSRGVWEQTELERNVWISIFSHLIKHPCALWFNKHYAQREGSSWRKGFLQFLLGVQKENKMTEVFTVYYWPAYSIPHFSIFYLLQYYKKTPIKKTKTSVKCHEDNQLFYTEVQQRYKEVISMLLRQAELLLASRHRMSRRAEM